MFASLNVSYRITRVVPRIKFPGERSAVLSLRTATSNSSATHHGASFGNEED
jgi:hypothetical protein